MKQFSLASSTSWLFSVVLISILFFAGSCKKVPLRTTVTLDDIKSSAELNYPFDWEFATSMPVSPSSPQKPSLPWQSQSGSYIPAALVSDFKYDDGWRLVYNTFNPSVIATALQQPAGGLYFALYNRYRGLLRFYLYVPPGLFGGSSNIEHGLSLYSDNNSTSPMLNFEGYDIIDAGTNIDSITKTNNVGIAIGGGWYTMQYEIAFDPNFQSTIYPNLGFSWNSRTINIHEILLEGTSIGEISGTVTNQTGGFTWTGALKSVGKSVTEVYGIASAAQTGESNKPLVRKLVAAIGNGLAGDVIGFFDGIFGGNSSNPEQVNLKMNAELLMNGNITSSQPLLPNTLVVPGQTAGNTVGAPPPLYEMPLGVFNLIGRPTVNQTTTSTRIEDEGGIYYRYLNYYTVDQAIFDQVFKINPAVINSEPQGAQIENLKTEILILDPVIMPDMEISGHEEIIGNYSVIVGTSTTYTVPKRQPANNSVAIRISFNIVPNNGAPSSLIVKTFFANLIQQ